MRTQILAGRSACGGRFSCSAFLAVLLFGMSVFDTAADGMDAQPLATSESVEESSPMADFARMEAGEWRLGAVHATTWRWGPGRHSIRSHRVGSDVDGNPWRELVIYFWHPDREQIHLLSFHPDIPGIGRGVGEGTIEFDGDNAVTSIELHQPRARRKLEGRWAFDGPDTYRDVLLEDSGRGLRTLAEWEYARSMQRSSPPALAADQVPTPSRNIRALVPLVGQWEGQEDGQAGFVRSNVEWMEYLDVVALSVEGASKADKREHLLEAYFYHHVGFDELRCVAIWASGRVYEGVVAMLEDNNLEVELNRYEGDAGHRRVVRFDVAPDETLRTRAWIVDGDDRTLVLDVIHRRTHEPEGD